MTRLSLALILPPLVMFCGCGDPAPQVQTPAASARAALEAGLKAWISGAKPGAIEGQTVPTQFVDSVWQGGRKLTAYTINGETAQGADRRFSVQLNLAAPNQTEDAGYIVIGANPIWIYRESDYERMLNMDDNPSSKKPRRN